MKIKYTHAEGISAVQFGQLKHNTWYRGGETGKLYYYYENTHGKPHLLRCADGTDCTSRYQRGGTFIEVDVTVLVHTGVAA